MGRQYQPDCGLRTADDLKDRIANPVLHGRSKIRMHGKADHGLAESFGCGHRNGGKGSVQSGLAWATILPAVASKRIKLRETIAMLCLMGEV